MVVHRQLRGCEDGGPNSCRPHAAVQGCQTALMPAVLDIDGWSAEAGGDVLLCRLCRLCRLVTALQMAGCHVAPAVWQLLQMHALNGNTNKQRAPAPAQPDRQHPCAHSRAPPHMCRCAQEAGWGRPCCVCYDGGFVCGYIRLHANFDEVAGGGPCSANGPCRPTRRNLLPQRHRCGGGWLLAAAAGAAAVWPHKQGLDWLVCTVSYRTVAADRARRRRVC